MLDHLSCLNEGNGSRAIRSAGFPHGDGSLYGVTSTPESLDP
jgi:hypothetical protein